MFGTALVIQLVRLKRFRAFILPSTSYALAITRDSALIWDYTSLASSPVPHILPLPQPAKSNEQPSLGSIVSTGPSSDVGLVVVGPVSGKIRFWENVESAESLGLVIHHPLSNGT